MTIRLNKVTRDLNVGITTVVEFLQKKGYTIEASPNAKITEEQYAVLVKEFSTDKNLKIESEKFSQERQNKDRNKASISIEGFESKKEKEEVVKTVIPEEARPKLKQVGKIDLDNLNKKTAPKVVEPVAKVIEQTPKAEPVVEKVVERKETPQPEKETPKPVVVEEKKPEPAPQPAPAPVLEEKKEPKIEKTEEKTPQVKEMEKETPEAAPVQEKEEDDVFKIRPTEFKSKINVVGQIDLAALNQSTRPKKKSKEEKRKEREEKDKQRQEQRKLMKDAIIKEIRKGDDKISKNSVNDIKVGISLQIQHFSFQQYFFQQIVYTCTFLCRNILRLILTTPLFHQEVHGSQFFLNLIRIGVRLIHLINSKYDRHTGSHSMINRLFGLRHHIIIGSYNNNSNIRHFRTTGTHGGKCLVTRSIQECNMTSVFQFHIVSTDMLGDTTCLTGNYICFTNIVQ
jgi:hypothetical protein